MILESLVVSAPEWAIDHAPVLIPVVPLIMAAMLALSPSGRLSWILSMVATAASFYFALLTLGRIQSAPGGIIEYWIGNWDVIGIEFRVDALNAMILLLVTGMGFLASIFAWSTSWRRCRNRRYRFSSALSYFASRASAALPPPATRSTSSSSSR